MTSAALMARVVRALDEASIRWCLLRGEEHVVSLEGDLDALVARDEFAAARLILRAHGFVAMPRLHRHDPVPFVALAEDGARWARVDITDAIRIGGFHFPIADALLARRSEEDGIPLLHPHDRFWTLLLHSAWDHGRVDDRHRQRLLDLVALAGGVGPVTDQLLQWGVPRSQIDHLRQCVAARRWSDLDHALGSMRRRGLGGHRPLAPVERFRRRLVSVIARARLGLTRPGMSVALLGPDGSGKSSLTDELCRSLPMPTRRLYVGLYQRRGERLPIPGVGFVLRLARLAGVGVAAAYHQARGRVVIFDRHPVELGIGLSTRTGTASRLRRWVLSRSFPPADVTLVLDAPASLLSSRKPEHTHDEALQQQEAYRRLARDRELRVITTSDGVGDARRRVVSVVWPRLAARARRRA